MPQGLPATDAFAITPHDTKPLRRAASFLRVAGAGDVKLKTMLNTDITIIGVLAGEVLWISAQKVYETGTTATGIIGFV